MGLVGDFYSDLWNGLTVVWILLGWLGFLIHYLQKPSVRILCLKSLMIFCLPFLIFYILENVIHFEPVYTCFEDATNCAGGRLRDAFSYSALIIWLFALIYLPLKARKS